MTHFAGRVVSHYRVLEMLGAGGMGVVYKGYDERLDRPVALKFLPPHLRNDPELKNRLKEEARAASDHPNIVVVHDIGETPEGDLFLAIAFHEGVTLQKRIERDQPNGMPIVEALQIARQIAAGLAKAHERGILHRDIKPGNIIVAKDGVARIIDFGLAKSMLSTMTADGTTKGTPLYMSPEQASGNPLNARTDIWSLGVVLYEMLTGRPPVQGEGHLAVMHAIIHDAPPKLRKLRPDLPADVERVAMRALEKDPGRRYQTAGEMAADLPVALGETRGRVDSPTRRTAWIRQGPPFARVFSEARRQADAALHLSRGGTVEFGAGFALALSGDAARAGSLSADLQKRFPEDTLFRTTYVPVLRALAALGRHDPAGAITELEPAAAYELAFLASHEGFNDSMYAVYVRGLAYLEQRRGRDAAVEFEKILKHRGIVLDGPIGAVSSWKLGQAYNPSWRCTARKGRV